jgi:hypothetical protein
MTSMNSPQLIKKSKINKNEQKDVPDFGVIP